MKAKEIMALDIDDQDKLEMMIEKFEYAYDWIDEEADITPEGYQSFKIDFDKIEASYNALLDNIVELGKRVRENKLK